MKNTKQLTSIAIAIALAVVCRFIKIWEMPQGGGVSLTMIPLLYIAIKQGAPSGITAGVVYGIISAICDSYLFHPYSLLLDYILAFGILGIAGLFDKNVIGIILGSVSATFGRLIFHLISGAVLFSEYAPAGQNPWLYSLIYQASYLVPELLITIVVIILLYKKVPKLFY